MSEVKRYMACIDGIPVGRQVVLAEDFDALQQRLAVSERERDAALAREAEVGRLYDSLVKRSNREREASEKREDALREELAKSKKLLSQARSMVNGATDQWHKDTQKILEGK